METTENQVNEKILTKKKTERYILQRYDCDDELFLLAKSISKKLGMSLSALCKLSLYTYCKPLQGDKKDEQPIATAS